MSPENLFTISWRVCVKEFDVQIIENIKKYPVYPVRGCHCICERRTSSRCHAFSELLTLALIKIHKGYTLKKNPWQILIQESGATFDAQALKLGIFFAILSY